MMWFEALMGFPEESPQQVRKHILVDGEFLKSQVNGHSIAYGRLETPSLGELRERVKTLKPSSGNLLVREIVANVQDLHVDASNAGALFQVASQFNLLEMVSPHVTPEKGVGIYENDGTQGPACAVAAGAGTIYRNYFAPVKGQVGQSAENQIDCLADLGTALGNVKNSLWEMKNGYALVSETGLIEISKRLDESSESEQDEYRKLLRIGLQWNTQVTLNDIGQRVSQAYCSALPVAYCKHDLGLWEGFARLVLEASYEATILGTILNAASIGNRSLYLTLLGGGVFGNETEWIIDAIERGLKLYKASDLNVSIVSYGASKASVRKLAERFSD